MRGPLAAAAFLLTGAGAEVRPLYMDDNAMETVRLSLGKSTLLRLPGKPEKIVIGNKNYHKVEFVENDVTIQPLPGGTTTNLFVYTASGVYGFILVRSRGGYDDLVKVRRKPGGGRRYRVGKKKVEPPLGLEIGKARWSSPKKGVSTISVFVENKTRERIKTGDIRISAIEDGKMSDPQKTYFGKASIGPGGRVLAKIVFLSKKRGGAAVLVRYGETTLREVFRWQN